MTQAESKTRGGARRGAGRKPGSRTKVSRVNTGPVAGGNLKLSEEARQELRILVLAAGGKGTLEESARYVEALIRQDWLRYDAEIQAAAELGPIDLSAEGG